MFFLLNMIVFLTYSLINAKDSLAVEKPDKYDLRMAKIDKQYENAFKKPKIPTLPPSKHDEIEQKKDKLDKQADALKKILKDDNVLPITSSDLWRIIYEYIKAHLKDFTKDNSLAVSFVLRYDFCLFIIPVVPANNLLVFPAFYKFLIPPKVKKVPTVAKFLAEFDSKLKIIQKKSSTQLLVTVVLKRTGNIKSDLEMILKIPDLIVQEPLKLLKWLFDFKIEIL